MRRVVKVKADGIDLKVTIEGVAPCGVARVMAREVGRVAFDFISNVAVTEEMDAETVEQ